MAEGIASGMAGFWSGVRSALPFSVAVAVGPASLHHIPRPAALATAVGLRAVRIVSGLLPSAAEEAGVPGASQMVPMNRQSADFPSPLEAGL